MGALDVRWPPATGAFAAKPAGAALEWTWPPHAKPWVIPPASSQAAAPSDVVPIVPESIAADRAAVEPDGGADEATVSAVKARARGSKTLPPSSVNLEGLRDEWLNLQFMFYGS